MFNWVLNKPACALTLAVVRRKNNIQYQVYVDIWKVLSVPLTKKTVTWICSIKKVFLKFRKIHNLCQSLFFKKVAGFSNYLFYGEIFKNTFFYRTTLVDASYQVTWALRQVQKAFIFSIFTHYLSEIITLLLLMSALRKFLANSNCLECLLIKYFSG